MICGVAIFDLPESIDRKRDIKNLDALWASVSGQEAKRLKSLHDLRTDVIWLTNLDANIFKTLKLFSMPNIRSETWLRTKFTQIQQELGLDESHVTTKIVAEQMSMVVQSVVDRAQQTFGVMPHSQTLNADFAKVFNAPVSNLPDAWYMHFAPLVQHSLVAVVSSFARSATNASMTVKPNRLKHAREVLATKVPLDVGWEQGVRIPNTKTDTWLENIDTPFLLRFSLNNINPDIAEILSWGAGSQVPREWMTDVEWCVLREFCDIEVKDILINRNPGCVLKQHGMLPSGMYDELSYTCGLVAELMWTSLTTKVKRGNDASTKHYTAAAAWLRSADRMIMFRHAQRLSADGCNISMYGTGMVILSYPEGALTHYLGKSVKNGLMPPTAKFQENKRGNK
ncbi:hypothetical protein SJI19_16960 [Acerihabitans sp. TG2]|uniref:hypothetical protein n=1 Tax=Acerihabitans sp. TG2 TaxID=3096008 RepID=UPI002B226C82|nr:hypothetical protein [Acerihabitans sp. TG2]MEA9392217.1 hypothetical protein [Acerihabitans sp. TG2]